MVDKILIELVEGDESESGYLMIDERVLYVPHLHDTNMGLDSEAEENIEKRVLERTYPQSCYVTT